MHRATKLIFSFSLLTLASVSLADDNASANKLSEVVVTATRSPVELTEFAGSISRMDSDEVVVTGPTHHSELLNRVPGANFQRNSGQESLTAIRSPVLAGAGSCGAFLFLEDSIPIRPVGFCNVNELFEVNFAQAQSVEVQRGPASAIYGSSAMHGAVNVITNDPARRPRFAIGVDGGEDRFIRGDVALAHRGSSYAVGFNANVEHDGGWRDDNMVNQQKGNLAYSQQFAGSDFSAQLSHTNLTQDTGGFIQGFEAYRNESIARSNPDPDAYRNAHATRLSTHWHKALSDSMDFDLRPYARSSRMEFLQHFLPGKPLERNGQDSGGVIVNLQQRMQGGANWLAGVDLEYADGYLVEEQFLPTTTNRPFGKHYDYTVISNVAALYGQWDQPLGDQWKVNLGVRAEHVNYNYDNRMIDGNTDQNGVACAVAGGCIYRRPADREDTFNTVTPKLGISWHFSQNHMTYASVVRGYRAPETTELYRLQRQQTEAPLKAEHLDSVEVGVRGSVSILNYAFAAYAMRKENVIFRDSAANNVSNGKTEHRGVEYELGWSPADALEMSVSGTWARHTYAFNALAESNEVIVDGNLIDTAPENIWNVRALWHITRDISSELEWQHMGGYYTDAANRHYYSGHNLLNLRTNWNVAEQFQFIARVMNVMDRAYADRADYNALGAGTDRYFPGRGRAFFLEARYQIK